MASEPGWVFHDTVTQQQDAINEARRQAERAAERVDREPER